MDAGIRWAAWRRRPRRSAAWLGVVVVVTLIHALVTREIAEARLDAGAAEKAPRRIEVAFVKELAPAAPPPVPPPRRKAPKRAVAAAQKAPPPASAPEPAPEPPPLATTEPPAPPVAEAASAPAPAAPETVAQAEPAASAPDLTPPPEAPVSAAVANFEWPLSTRLTYLLNGWYRGEVQGDAQVEWLRQGDRYQVHLDVRIGPSFAPLMTRRMSSDGDITRGGLRPRRYDEETRAVMRDVRRRSIVFEEDHIVLPGNRMAGRPDGVQDTASQFVQLTWLFTTQPEQLQPGRTVDIPLALPSNVDRWTYDVVGREVLDTPIGRLETLHMKPRREARRGGDLTVEVWFAPSLQYLPVRLLIRQDADTWADLLLERAPLQAAEPARR